MPLVTLNVHEDHNLEGVKIALHPDLFRHCANPPPPVAENVIGLSSPEKHETINPLSTPLVQINDLVEIRVWDAKSRLSRNGSNNDINAVGITTSVSGVARQTSSSFLPNGSTSSNAGTNNFKDSSTTRSVSLEDINHHPSKISAATSSVIKSQDTSASGDFTDLSQTAKCETQKRQDTLIGNSSAGLTNPLPARVSLSQSKISSNNQDPDSMLSTTHNLRLTLIMIVEDLSLTVLKSKGRTQISLQRSVADLYNLFSYEMVTVRKIGKSDEKSALESVKADYVTMTIKDQFISRGEMYQFQQANLRKWMFAGERLKTNEGFRGSVMKLRHGINEVKYGIVTEDTKITFRSRSARIIWLVQISSEMYEYASPYESSKRLFEKWKDLEVSHSLTVIFFSRTFLLSKKRSNNWNHTNATDKSAASAVKEDVYGRLYEDHLRIVVENETRVDWESLVYEIKRHFVKYPAEVGWTLSDPIRIPSTAGQGNFLEAINTTLNLLQLHYMDRDLHRSGNSIVLVTAGSGVFEVDKELAGITKQRMMDNGIGSDCLSLGLPPLHVAPFFLYRSSADNTHADETKGFDDWKTYFEIPHWMHLSYVSYDKSQSLPSCASERVQTPQKKPYPQMQLRANGFIARQGNICSSLNLSCSQVPPNLAKDSQNNLIAEREFEDILEACRPRNRRESISGLPSPLISMIKQIMRDKPRDLRKQKMDESEFNFGINSQYSASATSTIGFDSLQDDANPPKSEEWGSVNFDSISSVHIPTPSSPSFVDKELREFTFLKNESSDKSSASSSYGSKYSCFRGIQIQQSKIPILLDKNGFGASDTIGDEDSVSTFGTDVDDSNEKLFNNELHKMSLGSLKQLMYAYDSNVFSPESNNIEKESKIHGVNLIREKSFSHKSSTHGMNKISGVGIIFGQKKNSISSVAPHFELGSAQMKKTTGSSNNLKMLLMSNNVNQPRLNTSLELNKSDHPRDILNKPSFPVDVPIINHDTSKIIDSNTTHKRGKQTELTESSSPNKKHSRVTIKPKYKRRSKQDLRQLDRKSALGSLYQSRRRPWVLNPFRLQDEVDVYAKRTHNRRRWSHVYLSGETEFKRHVGPNWKSLCQPAILPLTIDFHPTPVELNDPSKYQFQNYEVALDAMDSKIYKENSELLMEMVNQRLIQNFQLVPQSLLQKSNKKHDVYGQKPVITGGFVRMKQGYPTSSESDFFTKKSDIGKHNNIIQHTLSMGHRIQIISFNPASNAVEVVQYLAKFAHNVDGNTFNYDYMLWMPTAKNYAKVSQNFQRYPEEYPWNKMDNIICGGQGKTLSEGTRARQIIFRIMPDQFNNLTDEQAYILKFKKLLEYIQKIVGNNEQNISDIKILSTEDDDSISSTKMRRRDQNLRRFVIPIGKRGSYEWMEILLDSTFHTKKTYRILIRWLVASAIKVENQVQLLHRRCVRIGLRLICFPHVTLSSNQFLNPFLRPEATTVQNKEKAGTVEKALVNRFLFVNDGKHLINPRDVQGFCKLKVPTGQPWYRRTVHAISQQYIHDSGTLLVRLLEDQRGWVIFVFLENIQHVGNDVKLLSLARGVFFEVNEFIAKVNAL